MIDPTRRGYKEGKGKDSMFLTGECPERALLVGTVSSGKDHSTESSLAELERLAHTAGARVVGSTTQRMNKPNPSTYIGKGKASEISEVIRQEGIDLVIFDDELTPSQQSNLERLFGKDVKVIDRTALILDIFALHATSREGRLQVRLAKNEYLYPRLRGMWAHLASNRMGGGVGSRFGEGESQLEVDRRIVRKRITSIKKELKELSAIRSLQREQRMSSDVFKVALAGYTNAGKSSLLNRICDSDVYSDDLLFATLDSTTRRLELSDGKPITITDTVGFIQKLPTSLIEAFKSTLDEIRDADLVLHVIDVSSDEYEQQKHAVENILGEIGAQDIPRIDVYNKSDLLGPTVRNAMSKRYPNARFVSAKSGEGIEDLLSSLSLAAASQDEVMSILLPYDSAGLSSYAHDHGQVLSEQYDTDGISMTIRIPRSLKVRYEPFAI